MLNDIITLWTMFVMLFNMCNQTNFTRKQCLTNWDEWLYPELIRGWNIKYGNEVPYQEEKEALRDHEQTQTIDD